MKVLVIGSGGREHALVKALKKSAKVNEVFAAPGNAGMAGEAICLPVKVGDLAGLVASAKEHDIDLTVVGPEQPLTEGIVDRFQEEGLTIFGPDERAAILEASKAFTKEFMKKYQIPTAEYVVFDKLNEARSFVKANSDRRWVVKVDGLAAGKGVFVPETTEATFEALEQVFVEKRFGEQSVVIEEFLAGEELSFMVLCDGETGLSLASSQDHKRLLDGDAGPNTGGMGAYSPAPLMDETLKQKVMERIIVPTLQGMKEEKRPFRGVLYAGLMIVNGEPLVLEYNVRFGDPEAQVILPRLESDWVDLFIAALEGRLAEAKPQWSPQSAVCVVLAAEGYPASPKKGDVIEGLAAAEEIGIVYHAGTAEQDGKVMTAGGRVLGVTALGKDLPEAVTNCYRAVEKINFSGMQYRKDIAQKGLSKK